MASNITDQVAHNLRLSDITSESGKMLPPIQGYENEPLVSLEKAVEPLASIVPQVNQMVYIVKGNCQNPKENLSPDESASIMLYSMEWTNHFIVFLIQHFVQKINKKRNHGFSIFVYLFFLFQNLNQNVVEQFIVE
jgi:hypothetical protein